MKKLRKKQKNYSSIYEEKGEVGQYLRNHNTSIQAKQKKSIQEISQVKNSVWYTPWEDSYGPPIDINPGQDTFEDYPVKYSRSALNLFLLFKLIYAGVIYSIMVYKSSMSSGNKICDSLFCFMAIAACICTEDYAERSKLKITKSFYGAKTYVVMGIYAVFTLFYCFLRYANQIENVHLLTILLMISLSNEGLAIIDSFKSERRNYVKLSGFKYIWMILMPILLILQLYGNLPYNHAIPLILANFVVIVGAEMTSMLFLSGIFPGYYFY